MEIFRKALIRDFRLLEFIKKVFRQQTVCTKQELLLHLQFVGQILMAYFSHIQEHVEGYRKYGN